MAIVKGLGKAAEMYYSTVQQKVCGSVFDRNGLTPVVDVAALACIGAVVVVVVMVARTVGGDVSVMVDIVLVVVVAALACVSTVVVITVVVARTVGGGVPVSVAGSSPLPCRRQK